MLVIWSSLHGPRQLSSPNVDSFRLNKIFCAYKVQSLKSVLFRYMNNPRVWIHLRTVFNFSIPRVGRPPVVSPSESHSAETYFSGSTNISNVSSTMVLKELKFRNFQNEYSAGRQRGWDSASYDHSSNDTSDGNSLVFIY